MEASPKNITHACTHIKVITAYNVQNVAGHLLTGFKFHRASQSFTDTQLINKEVVISHQLVRGQLVSKLLLGSSLQRALAWANIDLCIRGLVVVTGDEYVIEVVPLVGGGPLLLPLLLPDNPFAG